MDSARESIESQRVINDLEQQGWTVEREYAFTWRNRKLRADAVLLQNGAIWAVVEVKVGQVLLEAASRQLNLMADVLGAPLALIWANGQFIQMRNFPGVTRGPLSSTPTPADALQLLGSLSQLFRSKIPVCQAVTQAVHDWKNQGATRTGTTFLPAVEFYAAEHDLVCMKVPLTQCILISGMLEGILRETGVAKGATSKHTYSLSSLIDWCIVSGFITVGTGSMTPHAIKSSRNILHPNVFIKSGLVSQGVATNAALALAAVVRELNINV